ncbi:MAG: multidrug effflux MFS transporter, partial [Porphyromonadaceae bacterium]|nr:multidrug effflux MFS transporter [Porphyromonadaceae bacterium]
VYMGVLSVFGPFVTDFYLPTLPQLAEDFQTTTSLGQLTLTFSFIGLAVGQMIFGPLSDKYGRRIPLLLSLGLFVISTAACLFTRSIHFFLFYRFVQGFSGAGGLVISRSVIADLYTGNTLTRAFSLTAAVNGLAPIAAPVLGGVMSRWTDWHGIFVLLFSLGVVLFLTGFNQRETLAEARRFQGGVLSTFSQLWPVLRNLNFTRYMLIMMFASGVLFSYIASSPFIFQSHYSISPFAFSLCFGLNSVGLLIGSSLVPSLLKSTSTTLRVGSAGFFVIGLCVAVALVMQVPFPVVEGLFFLLLVAFGMIMTTSTALALDLERKNAGNASALLGFTQFFFSGFVSPLTGIGNILVSTGIVILLCSAFVFVISRFALRKQL